MKQITHGLILFFEVMMMLGLIAFLMTSCRTKYVPVTSVRTDTIYKSSKDSIKWHTIINRRDSIIYRDSLILIKNTDGTVVGKERYANRDHFLISERSNDFWHNRYDSILQSKQDSVSYPVYVNKELSKWQKVKQDVGGYTIFALIAVILYIGGRFVYKKFK